MAKKRNLRISLKGGNFFHIFIDKKLNKKLVNFLKKKSFSEIKFFKRSWSTLQRQ